MIMVIYYITQRAEEKYISWGVDLQTCFQAFKNTHVSRMWTYAPRKWCSRVSCCASLPQHFIRCYL